LPPVLLGTVLSQRWRQRQWQAIVRGVNDEQVAMLRAHEAVDAVDVQTPSLEDIFVATMQDEEG
jgi:hypothetical protein